MFAGKSFKQESEYRVESYSFTENTITYKNSYKDEDGDSNTEVYNYTYDSENALLYLSLKSESFTEDGKTYTWSSVSEYATLAKQEGGLTGVELESGIAAQTAEFATKTIYKYEISDDELKLTEYFDGTLPSSFYFSNQDAVDLDLAGGGFEFKNSDGTIKYSYYPSFADGTFSGTVYARTRTEKDDEKAYTYSSVGTVSGTYKANSTGTKDCGVTIKFTNLPEGLTAIEKDKDYVLLHNWESTDTYTLVE